MSNLFPRKSSFLLGVFPGGNQGKSTLLPQSGSWEKGKATKTFMGKRNKAVSTGP